MLQVLTKDPDAPKDLREKSIKMAAMLLEFTSRVHVGKGKKFAARMIENGAAYNAFLRIIRAQGGKELTQDEIPLGKSTHSFKSKKTGRIVEIDNKITTKICRVAGAPSDHGSGMYFYKKKGDRVKAGDKLFTIYSQNEEELGYAIEAAKQFKLMRIN